MAIQVEQVGGQETDSDVNKRLSQKNRTRTRTSIHVGLLKLGLNFILTHTKLITGSRQLHIFPSFPAEKNSQ